MDFKVQLSGDPHDVEWRAQAACKSDYTVPDALDGDVDSQRSVIKYYCQRKDAPCPVRLPCALDGLRYDTGSYGGLTTREFNKARPYLQNIAGRVAVEAAVRRQDLIAMNTNPVCRVVFPET